MKKTIISIYIIISLVIISGFVGATYSIPDDTTSIGGQVTDNNGKPISDALVLARSKFGTEYAISDDLGQYVLHNIPIYENIKISCFKDQYKTFKTSVYIDTVGFCLIVNIQLQKINNNIIESYINNF